MRVKDVIAELQKLPENAVVMNFNSGMEIEVNEVRYDARTQTVWID